MKKFIKIDLLSLLLLKNILHIDKIIYIGTTGSMWDNLYNFYCEKYHIDYDENYYLSLMENIEKANENTDIFNFDIDTF